MEKFLWMGKAKAFARKTKNEKNKGKVHVFLNLYGIFYLSATSQRYISSVRLDLRSRAFLSPFFQPSRPLHTEKKIISIFILIQSHPAVGSI